MALPERITGAPLWRLCWNTSPDGRTHSKCGSQGPRPWMRICVCALGAKEGGRCAPPLRQLWAEPGGDVYAAIRSACWGTKVSGGWEELPLSPRDSHPDHWQPCVVLWGVVEKADRDCLLEVFIERWRHRGYGVFPSCHHACKVLGTVPGPWKSTRKMVTVIHIVIYYRV